MMNEKLNISGIGEEISNEDPYKFLELSKEFIVLDNKKSIDLQNMIAHEPKMRKEFLRLTSALLRWNKACSTYYNSQLKN